MFIYTTLIFICGAPQLIFYILFGKMRKCSANIVFHEIGNATGIWGLVYMPLFSYYTTEDIILLYTSLTILS